MAGSVRATLHLRESPKQSCKQTELISAQSIYPVRNRPGDNHISYVYSPRRACSRE